MKPLDPSLETLLSEAVEILNVDERDAYLRKACGSDSSKLTDLQSMVRDYFAAGSIVDRPAAVAPTLAEVSTTKISRQIGPYKLRELLGEGGMGSVYVAEQERPVRRKVALKIIKPGMDSREVISRFESERQALALMDHPNIAKVLDAGTTENGLPYFVMELIKGVPITEHCDTQKLTTRERLELFIQVCQAVQHAHQKGIIHRDLKPSNIMVAIHDTTPVVKIIDFGVAKAIGQQLTDNTLYTAFSQLVGTPLYMSPEQAGQNGLDIDTRSDIYSLGVLLYELLTGNTPFNSDTLRKAGIDEMRRIIREVEPPKPSARISTLNALTQSAIAQKRGIDSNKFSQQFKGEIDWIVMKAMEKDRNRRYETASSFARDILNYLSDEAVEARPPSATYRMQKFAIRNKGLLLGGTLVATMLLLASIISIWQAIVATSAHRLSEKRYVLQVEAEKLARSEFQRAHEATLKANESTLLAIAEAEVAEGINRFLAEELLGQASPERSPVGDQLTMLEALDRASQRIDIAFPDKPKLKIAIHKVIGEAFHSLGEYEKSVYHFEAALDQSGSSSHLTPLETLNLQVALGRAYTSLGQWPEAEKLFRLCLTKSLSSFGLEHSSTFNAMSGLLELGKEREDPKIADEIEKTLGADFIFRGESKDSLNALAEMCSWLAKNDRESVAQEILRKAISVSEQRWGKDSPLLLPAKMNLGVICFQEGNMAEAESLLREALVGHERSYGHDDSKTMMCELKLAECLANAKKFEEAESLLVHYHDNCERVLGVDHPDTLNALTMISKVVSAQYRHAEATQLLRSNLSEIQKKRGEGHLSAIRVSNALANHLFLEGNYIESERLARQNLVLAKRVLGSKHSEVGRAFNIVDASLIAQRQHFLSSSFESAHLDTLFESANVLDSSRTFPGAMTMVTIWAEKLLEIGNLDEVETVLRLSLVMSQNPNLMEPPLSTASTMVLLGRTLAAAGRHKEAERAIRKGIEIRRRALPANHFLVAESESILGDCLTHMNRFDEAESLLVHSWENLENAAQFSVFQKAESLKRTIQHFERVENRDEVQRWGLILESLLKSEIQKWKQTGSSDKTALLELASQLGGCFTSLGRFDEAEQVLTENYLELLHGRFASQPDMGSAIRNMTKETCNRFAELRSKEGKADETAAWISIGDEILGILRSGKANAPNNGLDSVHRWEEIAKLEQSRFLDRFNLAMSYRMMADQATSNREFAEAIEWNAKSLHSLQGLLVYDEYKELTEAALGSGFACQAVALHYLGRSEDAWNDFEQALTYSQHQEVVLRVSNALGFLSDPEWRSKEGFEKRLAADESIENVRQTLLATVQYRAGKLTTARQTLIRGLETDPAGSPRLWLLLALIEAELGNREQSLQGFERAEEMFKRSPTLGRDRGIAWLRTLVDKSVKGESRIKMSEKSTQSEHDGIIQFANVTETLTLPDGPSFKLTSSLSIEAWVMLNAYPEEKAWIFFRGDNRGGLDPYELYVDVDGRIKFNIFDGKQAAQVASPFAAPPEQLIHVAATLNDSTDELSFYFNGTLVAQTKTTIRPFGELDPKANPEIVIAQQRETLPGEVDRSFYCIAEQVNVYGRALSAEEVLAKYSLANRQERPTLSIVGTTVFEGKSIAKSLGRFVADRSGGLTRPRGLTFGPDGNADGKLDLYVTSADTNSILRFDGVSGQFLDEFVARGAGGLAGPADLVFDAKGNLFVTSRESHQLLQFSSSGKFKRVVASDINKPMGVSLTKDGSLLVACSGANKILKVDGASVFDFLGEGYGGLKEPNHAIIGPDGDLYIANGGDSNVLKFDAKSGNLKGTFAQNPLRTGLSWIEFGPDGHLYATHRSDLSTFSIIMSRFHGTTGDYVDSFPLNRDGWSFIFGPDRLIYNASNGGGNNVERFAFVPAAELSVRLSRSIPTPVSVRFETADGTAVAGKDYRSASGMLHFESGETVKRLFVDTIENSIQRGNASFVVNLTNSNGAEIGEPSATVTIKDNDASRLWLLDDRSDRVAVSLHAEGGKNGGKLERVVKNSKPRGIAQQSERLWIVDADRKVDVYDLNLNPQGSWMAKTIQYRAKVEGIAVHDRDIWIVDSLSDRVYGYSNSTNAISGVRNATSMFNLHSNNTNPKDIATDGTFLWVVDDGAMDRVFKYSLDGMLVGNWSIDLENGSPTGIAVDTNASTGSIWIVDSNRNRVFEYSGASEKDLGILVATGSFMLDSDTMSPQGLAIRSTRK